METISEALEHKRFPARRTTVVVDTSVTLAMHWLIPLLAQFSESHPRMQVQVRTTDGPINPAAPNDVFIRRDETELRGLPHRTFMVERSVLVCAPAFMTNLEPREPQDTGWIRRAPRIGMGSRTDLWPKWSLAQNIAVGLEPTIEYDNTVLAIQAVLQGLGVLVVPEIFVSAMIETRAMVLLAAERVETGAYSYAVKRQQESMRVAVFTEWLMDRGRRSYSAAGVVRR